MRRLQGYLREDAHGLRVGAVNPQSCYTGPVAHVYRDGKWLYINTDDHEGCAMLNIEALPYLMAALHRLNRG